MARRGPYSDPPGTASGPAAELLAAVLAASRREYPREWAELAAMAEGAGVEFHDLLLLNLRGDLGVRDDAGCTDLAYVGGGRAVIAHNEDGDPLQDGHQALLTLIIDGDTPVTVWWTPGFIPANTFAATGGGLFWSIDNLAVRRPAPAAGRHFVARALQREATAADVVARLAGTRSAGGFAYTIGQVGWAEVAMVETAAGLFRSLRVGDGRPFGWHTNHALRLPSSVCDSYQNSEDRANFLARLTVPDRPDTSWF